MTEHAKWWEVVLIIYGAGNILPAFFQAIEYSEELDKPYWCIGCVINTYNYLEDQLNSVGLWIAVIAVFLLTLPAITISFFVWLIMKAAILFWRLFTTVFAKKK